jgi:hypothetical protein
MSFSNSGIYAKPRVDVTLSGRFQVTDSRFGKVSVIHRRQQAPANNERGSYPNLTHLCRLEAQETAISLMRKGQFTRTGRLDQSIANELLCTVIKNESNLDYFVQCVNQELADRKATYFIGSRIEASTKRQGAKVLIVDVYDFVGVRVDGFVHRVDTDRALSLHPARRWFGRA